MPKIKILGNLQCVHDQVISYILYDQPPCLNIRSDINYRNISNGDNQLPLVSLV